MLDTLHLSLRYHHQRLQLDFFGTILRDHLPENNKARRITNLDELQNDFDLRRIAKYAERKEVEVQHAREIRVLEELLDQRILTGVFGPMHVEQDGLLRVIVLQHHLLETVANEVDLRLVLVHDCVEKKIVEVCT